MFDREIYRALETDVEARRARGEARALARKIMRCLPRERRPSFVELVEIIHGEGPTGQERFETMLVATRKALAAERKARYRAKHPDKEKAREARRGKRKHGMPYNPLFDINAHMISLVQIWRLKAKMNLRLQKTSGYIMPR